MGKEWNLDVREWMGEGERKSYTNKYKWMIPALFLKGLAGNAGTLYPGKSSNLTLQSSLGLNESRAQLGFPGQRSLWLPLDSGHVAAGKDLSQSWASLAQEWDQWPPAGELGSGGKRRGVQGHLVAETMENKCHVPRDPFVQLPRGNWHLLPLS